MKIIVQKFGGTSVDTPENRLKAAHCIIKAKCDGFAPVVVVSAVGRVGEPYSTDALIMEAQKVPEDIATLIEFGAMNWLSVDEFSKLDKAAEPRELDLLMSCGEIISTAIMAHTLKCLGFNSIALTGGQAGIVTDHEFGNARILSIDSRYILECLKEDKIPVVAGFQGITKPVKSSVHGAITTLGRGGSDTTASALGVALSAERVEIYTDVEGVMTADPKIAPEAKTLESITYEEICEMAYQGAKILNPRAAEIALEYKIPLHVKSTRSDSPGTLIVAERESKEVVTAITHSPEVAYFVVLIKRRPGKERAEFELETYRQLAQRGVSIYLLTVDSQGISFVVEKPYIDNTRAVLEALETQFQLYAPCSIISAIGSNILATPGIIAKIAQALFDAQIEFLQVADSQNSASCLINSADLTEAVRAVHSAFGLGK